MDNKQNQLGTGVLNVDVIACQLLMGLKKSKLYS
jgi:hypothetical protein